MLLVLIGIATSILTSLAKWLNTKLSNTPLHGDGALLLSIIIAFVGSFGFLYWHDSLHFANREEIAMTFSLVFATADLYYRFIVSKIFPNKDEVAG